MVARSLPRCGLWFGLTALPLWAALGYGARSSELEIVLVIFGLFGLQGFAAEFLGVRADGAGVSFPGRFAPLGFPVFWRKSVPAHRISRVDPWGRYHARLFLTSGDHLDVALPNRHAHKKFLRHVAMASPGPVNDKPARLQQAREGASADRAG
ncbi:hypothetical protein [Methylocystis echinoides]|uniref:hypothetical protein n=1 Tax=Methylocystis echinoides TaxID=29468 RepID=UPI0024925359|nr:hypothetical protein [Methylocystis echinoides]